MDINHIEPNPYICLHDYTARDESVEQKRETSYTNIWVSYKQWIMSNNLTIISLLLKHLFHRHTLFIPARQRSFSPQHTESSSSQPKNSPNPNNHKKSISHHPLLKHFHFPYHNIPTVPITQKIPSYYHTKLPPSPLHKHYLLSHHNNTLVLTFLKPVLLYFINSSLRVLRYTCV